MCGIVGFFDTRSKALALPDAEMTDALHRGMVSMAARGPDGSGTFSEPGVVLGHRRLAVIDRHGGHQPFVDEKTGSALVYNGELFNFRELRETLRFRGHNFTTDSDTEVLLRAYLEWGVACLDRLSGMYAFAVYDPAHRQLILARDRFGVKPLFFHVAADHLVFASTCAALQCFPGVGRGMDLPAVSHYLTTIRTSFGRRTLFEDIQTLQPGEYLTARAGESTPAIRRYWDLPVIAPDDKEHPGINAAAECVRTLVGDSVKARLVSDVPLGGFLSGGIDSSVVTALARGRGGFTAYSTGYDARGYNEWPFIREAASFHAIDCTEVHLEQAAFPGSWRELIRSKGLPISTPNEIAIYHLALAARQDLTVALTGEGADEVLGGYITPFFSALDYDRARRSAPAQDEELSSFDRALMAAYRRPYLSSRLDHYFLVNSWMPFLKKRLLLNPQIWDALDEDAQLFGHYESWLDRFRNCSTFDAYMQIHARVNLEGLLSRVDSSTMAASLEARAPFTDHRLAEYVFSLPDSYKMDWKDGAAKEAGRTLSIVEIENRQLVTSKLLLRRAFRPDVPASILGRRKMSFPVPFREWFADGMHSFVKDTVLQSDLNGTIFDTDTIKRMLETADTAGSAMALWPVANLCLWRQECGIGP